MDLIDAFESAECTASLTLHRQGYEGDHFYVMGTGRGTNNVAAAWGGMGLKACRRRNFFQIQVRDSSNSRSVERK